MTVEQFKGDYDTCVQIETEEETIYLQVLCYEFGNVARAGLTPKVASQLAKALEYSSSLISGQVSSPM